jgi:uncharacterized protein (DUF924 family)
MQVLSRLPVLPEVAASVVDWWRAAGPAAWFAKDAAFDARFRARYLDAHEAAARDELSGLSRTAEGALALVLLLDQFPRNAFRGMPRMYATDAAARRIAATAIDAGHDRAVDPSLTMFFYLPFAHSEHIADQSRSVALFRRLGDEHLTRAEQHRDIVLRFGRFPHRNAILGRATTREEQRYLDAGGFAG